MDGHFVPNLTFGCPIIKAPRKHTTLPFDVHLMTEHPEIYFDDLSKAGAAMVSFHAEAPSIMTASSMPFRKRG